MLFSDAVRDYLDHLLYERGLSKATHYSYKSHLHQYTEWLTGQGFRSDATLSAVFTTPLVRKYVYSLSAKGLRPRTVRGAFHALRGIGQFCLDNALLSESPAHALRMPKKDAAVRKLISDEELVNLLAAVERQYGVHKVALSRAMIYTVVYCGLRTSELLGLKVQHVNLEGKTLLVQRGKGDKSRLLYPAQECLDAIAAWLSLRDKNHPTDWLWTFGKDRHVAEPGFYRILEEVKAAAGYGDRDNIKPHSIRHAFATRMMNNGADIKSIQAALGHSDAHTTLIYLHASEQPARAMANLASLESVRPDRSHSSNEPRRPKVDNISSRSSERSSETLRRRWTTRPV